MFETLFPDHYPGACRFARGLVGAAEAEDAVQDAFARMYEQRDRLPELRRPEAFLFRILYRVCLNRLRRRSVWARVSGLLHLRSAGPQPGDGEELRGVWGRFTPREKAVFFLVDYRNWEPDEAARALGMSPATLRVHRHRIRRKITDWEEGQ